MIGRLTIDDEKRRKSREFADWRKVFQRIVVELAKMREHDERRRNNAQGVAVGGGPGYEFGAYLGGGAGVALYHHCGAANGADLLRHYASHDVGWTARRERQDHCDRSAALRPGGKPR